MTFRSLLISSATITRETADGFDDYGNPQVEWAEVAEDIPCRVFEQPGKELTDDRASIVRQATLYVQAGTDVTAQDRVEVDGVTWEVSGPPVPAVGAAALHHLEVPLRQVAL